MDFFKSFMITANLIVMMMLYSSLMEVLATNQQSLENDIKLEHRLNVKDQQDRQEILEQNDQDARDRGEMMAAIQSNSETLKKLADALETCNGPLSQRGAAELSQDK